MKKRMLALIAASIMALSAGCFCGCTKTEKTDPSQPNNPVTDNSQPNGTDTNNPNTGDTNNPNGDNKQDNRTPTVAVPNKNKVTVYYTNTNSNNWSKVYAYVWNNSTQAKKKVWPGEELSSFGASGYGERQYKIEVDTSVYNRIIFNDNNGHQTVDLTVSAASSGYFGAGGSFTYGAGDKEYGKVKYETLTDTKNLSYMSGSKKKISVYTPRGYDPKKKYGVLYMFDGQNLFEAADGYKPEGSTERWQADVAVNNLVQNGGDGVIIVGIDNGDGHRDQELTMGPSFGAFGPLSGSAFHNGKLDELGNFIKETVMPWVKEHYSVDASREKTGIAGSSSGGIAAYYLGLRDNDTYGYIGAFSPAIELFADSAWNNFYRSKNNFSDGKPKVYAYCGEADDAELLPGTKKIKSGLLANGYSSSDITEYYFSNGNHNEIEWRAAFPEFLGKLAK